jgi:hypothetical protein
MSLKLRQVVTARANGVCNDLKWAFELLEMRILNRGQRRKRISGGNRKIR